MTYSLNTIILEPLSKKKPRNAVILCHGYGGDGKDISILANYWRAHLPETIFLCPDAPERCAASPTGFQWFDLIDQSPEQILSKSLIAEKKLNKLIDEVKDRLDDIATGLSGGQQQRICIARAIAVNPEVILMDEPCSALDPIATAKIEELMNNLASSYTIIIVTHSMQQAGRVSQNTAFFHMGDLVETGETAKIFTQPDEQRTQDYITGRFG